MGSNQSKQLTCRPIAHPSVPVCEAFMFELGKDCFVSASKLYASLFIITALVTGKKLTSPAFVLTKLVPSIIRSSSFIAVTGALWARFTCLLLNVTGQHWKINYFSAPFFAALIGIHIEKPQRRGELTVYVANHAAEVIFRMLADRGYVQPIRFGMVYLFSFALAVLLYYFTNMPHMLGTSEASAMRLFFGKEDRIDRVLLPYALALQKKLGLAKDPSQSKTRSPPSSPAAQKHQGDLPQRHASATPFCKHGSWSCELYSTEGLVKGFAIGYLIRAALNLLPMLLSPRKLLSPSFVFSIFGTSSLKLGASLAFVTGAGRGIQCLLRHKRGVEDGMNQLLAGFVAGLSFYFVESTEIGMFTASKAAYVLIKALAHQGTIPTLRHAEALVFSFCTALLFYSGFFQPHYLRPSYFKFLIKAANKFYPLTFRNSEDVVRRDLGPSYREWKARVADKLLAKVSK